MQKSKKKCKNSEHLLIQAVGTSSSSAKDLAESCDLTYTSGRNRGN